MPDLPATPVDVPKALVEPARRVGNLAALAAGTVGTVLAVVTPLTDLVPGQYHAQVSAAIAVAAGAVAVVARVSAELIRGKVTPFDADLAEQYREAAKA